VPITERIISRLGRPRWLWILLWSLLPCVSPVVFVIVVRLLGQDLKTTLTDLFTAQGVLSYVCLVLLVGVAVLGRQAMLVQPDLARLMPSEPGDGFFAGIGSVRGPLLLSAGIVVILTANAWSRYGPVPPLVDLPLLFGYVVPIMTFVWVYLTILVDLDRLGRHPLVLDRFPEDRTLGLEKLGSLASTGLGLLLAAAVPILLVSSIAPVALGINLAIVAFTLVIFVLSMWRLHRQMAAARARYVALAGRLYRDAYAPIRDRAGVDALEAQATALRAAQSLDERAHSLASWPVEEGTLRFIAVVITGVVTSLIVRGLFAALGF
jgi:hypothetical protein